MTGIILSIILILDGGVDSPTGDFDNAQQWINQWRHRRARRLACSARNKFLPQTSLTLNKENRRLLLAPCSF